MIHIAICDDEKEIRDILADMVQKHCPYARISLYSSGDALLLSQRQPDILFLDIQMSGKNGMETARELRRTNKQLILIFVTAIEEYVFQAFDVGAFHYLVKPFPKDQFETVLNRAVEQYNEIRAERPVREEKFILIQSGGIHTKVFLRDIKYAEIYNRKVIIHKTDGEVEYYGKLGELEKQAGEDFFRPHRAYLVHFKYVTRYQVSTIYLDNDQVLMAKQNYPEFVKSYLNYNKRKGNER